MRSLTEYPPAFEEQNSTHSPLKASVKRSRKPGGKAHGVGNVTCNC